MKKIMLLLLLIPGLKVSLAQVKPEQAVLKAMQQLLSVYNHVSQLSFKVNYRYAAEETPGVYLDSLNGQVKISGSRYWYDLALTEYILNTDYQIMIFKEDQLIYLARPSREVASAMTLQGLGPQNLTTFDSLLTNSKDISCNYSDNATEQILQIVFVNHPVYKKISWNIDKSTGYIKKITSVVKAGQLYDPSIRSQVDDKDTYAIVEASFSNYSAGIVDESLFNSNRYFIKEGQAYKPTEQYRDYKIFLGTPGL
jgi:hypothetical protein